MARFLVEVACLHSDHTWTSHVRRVEADNVADAEKKAQEAAICDSQDDRPPIHVVATRASIVDHEARP